MAPITHFFLLFVTLICRASSFTLVHHGIDTLGLSTRDRSNTRLYLDIEITDLTLPDETAPVKEEKKPEVEKQLDSNEKEFVVGGIVRVVVDGLKAYQISPAGYGSFNEDKEFVKVEKDDSTPRSVKNFALPVGLRGVIKKVYDTNDISANFPVQVKFVKGETTEEGYAAPANFFMHFDSHEVEVV